MKVEVDHDATLTVNAGETADIVVEVRDVPTFLVDSVIGFVTVGDLPRVTLGQIAFKTRGEHPIYLPQLTIAAPREALRFMAAQLMQIAGAEDDGALGGDDGEAAAE